MKALKAGIWGCICYWFIATSQAEEASLPRIDVLGKSKEDMNAIAGAVGIVSQQDLQRLQPTSTEAALKGVAGVVIKPEEESAIVANIGMRGLSAGEYKTLILEDGVPVAPDLFFGNSRYYNPRIQRMESIEILKGAASLRYGPNTIGGVINYKTKDPTEGASVSAKVGSHQYQETSLETGARSASGDALAGLFFTNVKSNGFQNKRFDMQDLMLKGGMAISEQQWLGVKLTHYQNKANISYRGLFLNEYLNGATYNPAPDDWFLTDRDSLDINHEWQIDGATRINTLAYWSQMNRDYWRYNVNAASSLAAGRWNFDVQNDGNPANDTLNGNNRAFDRLGFESRLTKTHGAWGLENEIEAGVRWMKENMSDQKLAATRANPRTGTLSTDVQQTANSIALFAQNRTMLNQDWSMTPGLRVEHYQQKTDNLKDNSKDGTADNTEVMPGVGVTVAIDSANQIYAGVYKAFSPAYNSTSIVSGTDLNLGAEKSTNLEIGIRGTKRNLSYEFTVFQMDFDNQVIRANSNGGDPSNAGKTLHQGMELAASYKTNGLGFQFNTTFIPTAKFVGTRYTSAGAVDTPDGNRVTYSPEWVANMVFTYEQDQFSGVLSINHVGSQFTDNQNTLALKETSSGFFTGKINAYYTADLNLQYAVGKQLVWLASMKNLTNQRYIASLREGIYAGPDRTLEAGIQLKF